MKKKQEISLFRKLIDIHHEEVLKRRAFRNLSRQKWSIEFLISLCSKAAKLSGSPIEITVTSPDRQTISIKSLDIKEGKDKYDFDDNVLNRLDDTAYVEDYIRRHSV